MQLPYYLPEPILTDNASEILKRRYLIKDENGEPVEEPKDMFWRVAKTIAQEEEKYGGNVEETANEFYIMMSQNFWLPNSPTLMNAGRPLGQLSGCFVLPVEDSMSNGEDGIYDTLKDMALVHQSGGGTGFSFSRLRASGSVVRSTTGVASGPISFMSLYDASTDVVKQGGTRRGANMGILRVDHPNVLEFISCKRDTSKINNFNISVAVTDAFMDAVRLGEYYDLVDHSGNVVGELFAPDVWDTLVESAWLTGEPGLFFIDEANRHNPVPHMGEYEATNPCGEQPLLAYDTCNLGSLNLGKFVREGEILWDELAGAIKLSTRFMDNVIDANKFPIQKIKDLNQRIRRIGCGVMGWADMLIALGIPYDSEEALSLARQVGEFFAEESYKASEELAAERGVFPEWEHSIWGPNDDRRPTRRLRHSNITTVAPTGTISIIAGCSSGIEPIFAVAFMRNQAGAVMPDVHPKFKHFVYSDDAPEDWEEVVSQTGNIDHKWVSKGAKRIFRTASDVGPEYHVGMQAAWQEHIDSAISKTINMPNEAQKEDVEWAYMTAYQLGCKGITVYRDGSRPRQVLSTGKTTKAEAAAHVVEDLEKLDDVARNLRDDIAALDVEQLAELACANGACSL